MVEALKALIMQELEKQPTELSKDDFWWQEARQAAAAGNEFMLTTAVKNIRPDVWEAAAAAFTKNGKPLFGSGLAVVEGLLEKCTNPDRVLFFQQYLAEMAGGFVLIHHGVALTKANNARANGRLPGV